MNENITIEGKEYEVPDAAEYVAMDEDGGWHWYASKPEKGFRVWRIEGDYGLITHSSAWYTSLRKI